MIAVLEVTVLLAHLDLDVKVPVLYKCLERYITGAMTFASMALLLANCTIFVTLLLRRPVYPSVQEDFKENLLCCMQYWLYVLFMFLLSVCMCEQYSYSPHVGGPD